jgi:hypothetical protein
MARQTVKAIALPGVADFVLFVLGAAYFGGDALNGYRKGGCYFLGLHSNGPFTEVKRGVFLYSQWHAATLIAIIVAMLVAELRFRVDRNRKLRS